MNNLTTKETFEFILNEGKSSTSFLTLYSGFKYYKKEIRGEQGLIAYMDAPSAWVGASDPIFTNENILKDLILDFFSDAEKNGKTGILLPVSKESSQIVRDLKLFAIQIGSEPWFTLSESIIKQPLAKQLISKGAFVETFDPAKINSRDYAEIEEVTRKWIKSRKMPALGFLNRLEPWTHLTHKKYFRVIYNGHQVGYLSAVPCKKNKAWYLVDLIRLPNSPSGTTELLILEAMKKLYSEGATQVTLGMSPLALLDSEEKSFNPKAFKWMNFAFKNLNSFYHFQSLFQYKAKFQPNYWEPNYLIASKKNLSLMDYYSLFSVLIPQGFFSIITFIISDFLKKLDAKIIYQKIFTNKIVLRSLPNGLLDFLYRIKTTLILITANILFFVVANEHGGNLRARFIQDHAYQWKNLIEGGFTFKDAQMLIIPSLLHWNMLHLISNMSFLLFFVGILEIVVGSTLVSAAYLLGVLLSNLLTSITLIPLLNLFSSALVNSFKLSVDVGCSLGIFSCIGFLTYCLKFTKTILSCFVLGILLVTFYQNDLLSLNHLTAMFIGLFIAQYFIPKEMI